ncbi:MAG: OmpH family outer membrane protein [Synergistaceae bacterium]|jgi:outer membrane protein|nr:OmpH family outer membrane protein [Synergistaceae bacterium]
MEKMMKKAMMKKALGKKMALLGLIVALVAVFYGEKTASAADTIGVIDSQGIISKHPAFEEAAKQLQQIAKQKESEAKAAADKEKEPADKAKVVQAKRVEMAKEEQRLMEPIFKDCQEAVRVVAKKKNVTLVLEKASVYFGGMDITDDVIQQLKITATKK